MVRKFLYAFAILIALVIAAAVAWRLNPGMFMRAAFVPSETFVEPVAPTDAGYASADMWIARPGMAGENPSLWMPRLDPTHPSAGAPTITPGEESDFRVPVESVRGDAAIFFIHPTSYLKREHWNAPIDDEEANWRAGLFVRGQAGVFAGAGEVWAPRYRQAAMGAFLTRDVATANRALNAAYRDVEAAFDQFLSEVAPDRPIILAGHSQGALHLARLLRERIADRPIAGRIAAAYVIGWPISVTNDLPHMGLPACADADSTNCILAWQSFAEPADASMVMEVYDTTIGFDGTSRNGSRMLCVNPITGVQDGAAPSSANRGTLRSDSSFSDGTLHAGATGARCDEASNGGRGLLLIGDPPDLGGYVLPGNNYHVYDYSLFWANVRADVRHRLERFGTR